MYGGNALKILAFIKLLFAESFRSVNEFTFASKSEKSAKPPLPPNGSLPKASDCWGFLKLGGRGLGGAGLGGGFLLFLGGKAGLGLVGRGGADPSLVGACKMAKGSQPNGSFSA